jgi:hypothetical protein
MLTKPLGYRLSELLQSLQVIQDCLHLVRHGRRHQLIPISGQLRSLLTERSKGTKPLLLGLAADLNADLHVYAMPGVAKAVLPAADGLLLHVSGFPLSLERENRRQEQMSIAKFLDHKIVRYKTRTYRVRDIIEFYANKAGGSHYSSDIPKDFAEILSLTLGGQTVLGSGLQQIAELVLQSGIRVFKKLVEFEINLAVWIPKQDLSQSAHLLDHVYPGTQMRVAAGVLPGMNLFFTAQGLNGERLDCNIADLDWTKPHQLSFAHTLRDDLRSELSIGVDGTVISTVTGDGPILVVNDPRQYQSFVNRSQEDPGAGMTMGLVEQTCHAKSFSASERAKLAGYFRQRLSKSGMKAILFKPSQYGSAAPGTKDLTMTGHPVSADLSQLVAGEHEK